jgi:predicted acyl esterase
VSHENGIRAILGWGPFGKRGAIFVHDDFPNREGIPKGAVSEFQAWEAPDPAYWCNHGYAVINPDPRGIGSSEENIQF